MKGATVIKEIVYLTRLSKSDEEGGFVVRAWGDIDSKK